ncbi:hypothetical protein C5167_000877 [Papaver somniferum]|uniref:Uncharacterized protein n=1 Tax=Papaver somniferum TaxID=3469 RepID=A0A4Y7KWL7_PAPSO|nr:hypothetical protein C5167_000877 [Papaver somniferum]
MAATTPAGVQVTDTNTTNVEGMVNIKGNKMVKSNNREFGGWSCASRILFLGGVESFIFYGIASNLISFLTTQLGQSTSAAAQNVNAWTGFMHMLPLLAVYVIGHPSYFNRYLTILISGAFYLLGACSDNPI